MRLTKKQKARQKEANEMANYMIKNKVSVSKVAKHYGKPKATVYDYITNKLRRYSPFKILTIHRVNKVLRKNRKHNNY